MNSFHKLVRKLRKDKAWKFVSVEWRDGIFSDGYYIMTWKNKDAIQIWVDDIPSTDDFVASVYSEADTYSLAPVMHVKYIIGK